MRWASSIAPPVLTEDANALLQGYYLLIRRVLLSIPPYLACRAKPGLHVNHEIYIVDLSGAFADH